MMKLFRGLAFVVSVVAGWCMVSSSASALTVVRGVSNNSETMWIGMVDDPNVAGTSRVATLCIDGPGSGNDSFISLGSTALNDDYNIHGDSADGGTGSDIMIIVSTDGTNPSGYCGTSGSAGSTWNRLAYGGHILDMFGDGGNDAMVDGGGSNDTWMHGGGNDDGVHQTSSIGLAAGDAGDDDVFGLSSGSGDWLEGGDDADCLWDSTNTFQHFDCGNDTGDTRYSGNTGTSGCINSSACCGPPC